MINQIEIKAPDHDTNLNPDDEGCIRRQQYEERSWDESRVSQTSSLTDMDSEDDAYEDDDQSRSKRENEMMHNDKTFDRNSSVSLKNEKCKEKDKDDHGSNKLNQNDLEEYLVPPDVA